MPPKLVHGQTPAPHIEEIEDWLERKFGSPGARYTHFVDPLSLGETLPFDEPRWVLVVDTAEQDHVALVRRLRLMSVFAVAHSVRSCYPLPDGAAAGDIVVLERVYGDDEHPYVVHLDAERKAIPDFIASFKDGRRERQRAEHAASSARRHMYIIEGRVGDLSGTPQAMWMSRLNSAMDSLACASPFALRQIDSHADLVATMANMVRYVAREVMNAEAGVSYFIAHGFAGKKVARDMHDPATAWSGMLQAFPGISPAAASAIQQHAYPTFLSFCRAVVAAADDSDVHAEMEELLSNVKVPSTNSASSRTETRLGARGTRLLSLALPDVPLAPKRRPRPAARPAADDSDDELLRPAKRVQSKAKPAAAIDPLWDMETIE